MKEQNAVTMHTQESIELIYVNESICIEIFFAFKQRTKERRKERNYCCTNFWEKAHIFIWVKL